MKGHRKGALDLYSALSSGAWSLSGICRAGLQRLCMACGVTRLHKTQDTRHRAPPTQRHLTKHTPQITWKKKERKKYYALGRGLRKGMVRRFRSLTYRTVHTEHLPHRDTSQNTPHRALAHRTLPTEHLPHRDTSQNTPHRTLAHRTLPTEHLPHRDTSQNTSNGKLRQPHRASFLALQTAVAVQAAACTIVHPAACTIVHPAARTFVRHTHATPTCMRNEPSSFSSRMNCNAAKRLSRGRPPPVWMQGSLQSAEESPSSSSSAASSAAAAAFAWVGCHSCSCLQGRRSSSSIS